MNNGNRKISEGTISRAFTYLRELAKLADVDVRTISSSELGERLNLSDSQVRRDLGCFGNFGTSGSGYEIKELKKELRRILGKDKIWNVIVVGVGHLGSALLAYSTFKKMGLEIVAAVDKNTKKSGKEIKGILVYSNQELPSIIKNKNISIGIITVPANNAQGVANELVKCGIEYIMNFAPISLNIPDNVKVKNVDLCRELETLSYFLANKSNEDMIYGDRRPR